MIDSLNLIEINSLKFTDQDESLATYANKIDKREAIVDWNLTAKQLVAKIKGLNPLPEFGLYIKAQGLEL